jgi:hypothetical protein
LASLLFAVSVLLQAVRFVVVVFSTTVIAVDVETEQSPSLGILVIVGFGTINKWHSFFPRVVPTPKFSSMLYTKVCTLTSLKLDTIFQRNPFFSR